MNTDTNIQKIQINHVPLSLLEAKGIGAQPKQVPAAVVAPALIQAKVPGINFKEIAALDLTKYRNSNIPGSSYLLLLLPVIGWIALLVIKIRYSDNHNNAKIMMKNNNYDSLNLNGKIALVSKIIVSSPSIAWQYQFERAKLYILKGEYDKATNDLYAVGAHRGSPKVTSYDASNANLISFKKEKGWGKHASVLKVNFNDTTEALLFAAAYAGKQQYQEAYDAYNQVSLLGMLRSNIRKNQLELVDAMKNNQAALNPRGLEIIEAERDHAKKIALANI